MSEMALKDLITEELSKAGGKIGFYYRNLTDGEIITYHEDVPMMAASVIKLLVMTEAFRQFEAGILSPDRMITIHPSECVPSCGAIRYMHDGLQVTVLDLVTLMIILSDNSATNYLIDILGQDNINACIESLGYKTVRLNRKMYETEKSSKGIQNYICAAEIGDLLGRMAAGTLVSPQASAKMLSIMKDQQINHKIPFEIYAISEDIEIAHKTGEDDGITHDVGIVYAKKPFIVAFCGNETDVPAYERIIGHLSMELYRRNNL